MRDSIGGSLLLYLVIIFAGLVITLFVSVLSYSKAYRVKNRTIELLERYETFLEASNTTYDSANDVYVSHTYDVMDALLFDLSNAGYERSNPTDRCKNIKQKLISKYGPTKASNLSDNINDYNYNLCIYEMCNEPRNPSGKCKGSFYFIVVTFARFDVPVIGDVLQIPVYGETKTLGKKYDY